MRRRRSHGVRRARGRRRCDLGRNRRREPCDGLREVELGEGAIVGVGGASDHGRPTMRPSRPVGSPDCRERRRPTAPGRAVTVMVTVLSGHEVADHRGAGGGGVVGIGTGCSVPWHLDGPCRDDLDDRAGEDRSIDVGGHSAGAQFEVIGPQVDQRVAARRRTTRRRAQGSRRRSGRAPSRPFVGSASTGGGRR